MKKLGGYMFFFGVGSALLYLFNMEFIVLSWIETWGPNVGWLIRGALAVVGAILWLKGNSDEAVA